MSIGQIGILSAILVYLVAMVYIGFLLQQKGGVTLLMSFIWEEGAGAVSNCHECGGIGHEQLAADGTSRGCLYDWHC